MARSPASSISAWPRLALVRARSRSGTAATQRPALHEFLRAEYGYNGSYVGPQPVTRYAGLRSACSGGSKSPAQSQSDWGEFRRVTGDPDGPTTVYAFVMVLSHSRKEAVV